MGGEKDAEACKSHELDEVLAYKAALTELVKAVSIAHYLGKGPDDFWALISPVASDPLYRSAILKRLQLSWITQAHVTLTQTMVSHLTIFKYACKNLKRCMYVCCGICLFQVRSLGGIAADNKHLKSHVAWKGRLCVFAGVASFLPQVAERAKPIVRAICVCNYRLTIEPIKSICISCDKPWTCDSQLGSLHLMNFLIYI